MSDTAYNDGRPQPIHQHFVNTYDSVVNPPQYMGYVAPQNRPVTTSTNWGAVVAFGIAALVALAVLTLVFSGPIFGGKEYAVAMKDAAIADANARVGMGSKTATIAAVQPVAASNAQAHMGSNGEGITAVYPVPAVTPYTGPTVVAPRAVAPFSGFATRLPNGRCMAPIGSPQEGQMGYLYPDGTCKGRPPAAIYSPASY